VTGGIIDRHAGCGDGVNWSVDKGGATLARALPGDHRQAGLVRMHEDGVRGVQERPVRKRVDGQAVEADGWEAGVGDDVASLPAVTGVSQAALYGLLWLLGDLAAQQPVLLLVDDAHWADEPSLAWLGYISSRLATLPAAVVAATRPPPPAGSGALVALLAPRRDVEVLSRCPRGARTP
jgi:hypothetical protein